MSSTRRFNARSRPSSKPVRRSPKPKQPSTTRRKRHEREKKSQAIAGSLVVVAAGLALWLSPGSTAIDQVNDKPAPLGLVSLVEGQTLRVAVAHVIGLQGPPIPDRVCSLQVGFVDAQNRNYGIPDTFELRPGMARSFDFRAAGDGSVRPVAVDLQPRKPARQS